MSDTKAERLADAVNDFLRASPDVEASAVVSFDGLAMASALPSEVDEDRMGAMSAALLSLGEQAARGLGRGELKQIFVEGENGFVFLMSARDQALLAAVTDRQAKIGLMLYEMRHAADAVGRVLQGRAPETTELQRPEVAVVQHLASVPDEAQAHPNGSGPVAASAPDPGPTTGWSS
jgi:uncharacterized protein